MTFIRRLTDSISIFTNPEQQTQDATPTQTQTNLGVANNADLFESSSVNNFDLMQQQIQTESPIQESTPPEVTVDASSLFLAVDTNAPQPNSRLQELKDRLAAVTGRLNEIRGPYREEMIKLKTESLELSKTAQEIRASAEDDHALTTNVLATLDSLGIVAAIGGFPVPQIALGILGSLGIGGLSYEYKQQMFRAAAELEKRAGEKEVQAANLNLELEDLLKQAASIEDLIKEEERRLSQPFDELQYSSNLIAQTPSQEYRPVEDFIKNDQSSTILFNSDIQKLTTDE